MGAQMLCEHNVGHFKRTSPKIGLKQNSTEYSQFNTFRVGFVLCQNHLRRFALIVIQRSFQKPTHSGYRSSNTKEVCISWWPINLWIILITTTLLYTIGTSKVIWKFYFKKKLNSENLKWHFWNSKQFQIKNFSTTNMYVASMATILI